MMSRMQRIEAVLPSLEKAVQSQTSHIHLAYVAGTSYPSLSLKSSMHKFILYGRLLYVECNQFSSRGNRSCMNWPFNLQLLCLSCGMPFNTFQYSDRPTARYKRQILGSSCLLYLIWRLVLFIAHLDFLQQEYSLIEIDVWKSQKSLTQPYDIIYLCLLTC